MNSATGPAHDRYPCFDGIRAIAALMVIVYHAVFFATWFDTPGGRFLWNLNAGVWAFFATSGFLLYRPFAASHVDGAPTVAIGRYGLRRVARIYPAYWAVLAFFTFVVARASIKGVDGFFQNVTLSQTYVRARNPFLVGLPPAWSLVVEMTFYIFLPVYAIAIGALARRWRPLATELAGVAVLVAVGIGAIVAVGQGYDAPWITVLPQHIAAFALGMLLAVLSTHRVSSGTRSKLDLIGRASWAWWTAALVAFIAIPLAFRVEPFTVMTSAQTIGLNVCQTLLGFCLVVPAVFGPQHHGAIRRVLQTRTLVFLGLISYGLYLWHWFVLQIVQEDWLGWPLQKGNWVVVLALGLPIVIAAATASWYLLERPVLRWAQSVGRPARTRGDVARAEPRAAMRDA